MAEATELFKAIGEAYLCLRDPEKRAAYDSCLEHRAVWCAPEDDGFTFGMAKARAMAL